MTSERSDYCRMNDEEKNTGPTALIPHRDKVPCTGTKIHSSRATGYPLKKTFGTFRRMDGLVLSLSILQIYPDPVYEKLKHFIFFSFVM